MSVPVREEAVEGRVPQLLLLTSRRADYEEVLSERDFEKRLHQNHPYFYLKTRTGDVRITHVGVGSVQTRRTLRKLSGLLNPDFLLVAGSGGALKEDLSGGDVFLPTAIRDSEIDRWHHPPTECLRWITGTLKENPSHQFSFRSGPLFTVREPVVDPSGRTSLHSDTGALLVDMESTIIIRELIVPTENPPVWSVLRVVSDTFEDRTVQQIKDRQPEASAMVSNVIELLVNDLDTS